MYAFQVKLFSFSRLSDFNITHVENGYLHWAYTPSSRESTQQAEGASIRGKVSVKMLTSFSLLGFFVFVCFF